MIKNQESQKTRAGSNEREKEQKYKQFYMNKFEKLHICNCLEKYALKLAQEK